MIVARKESERSGPTCGGQHVGEFGSQNRAMNTGNGGSGAHTLDERVQERDTSSLRLFLLSVVAISLNMDDGMLTQGE